MPALAKTSDDEIITAAKRIVERAGIEALSMQAVAEAVDVRAPSLYKRFADRDALVRTVQVRAFADLRSALGRVSLEAPPRERLSMMANAYRSFARRHKRLYAAMFSPVGQYEPDDLAIRAAAAQPLLETVSQLVDPHDALSAARLLTAFVHGFVSMELSATFRLGGDIDAAYAFGIERLVTALASRPARSAP